MGAGKITVFYKQNIDQSFGCQTPVQGYILVQRWTPVEGKCSLKVFASGEEKKQGIVLDKRGKTIKTVIRNGSPF